ncbi:serpin family protein [Thermomonospora amylolytica]|uniref:serpin family protein n=1 Tax=Thermomonospora amylolytica TaxID=1411117 RepID=UPI000E6C6FAB|nr:serpin family protein [Thermomonospora amylolytica]
MGQGGGSLIESVNALTVRWAAAACSGTESVVFSGAGVWPLLAFLAEGAAGPGRDELQQAVGVDAAGAARAAREVLGVLDASPAVRSALGLWTGVGLPLRPEWAGQIPADTRGELTGKPREDQERLNAWADERTGGLIPAMPVEIDEDTRLVLAGALTVRTAWDHPFSEVPDRPAAGPWADREIAVLRRALWTFDDLRAADAPGGPLTMLRVAGSGEIDVHLLLGDPARFAGDVLAAGVAALAGRHRITGGSALPEGDAAPGVVVRTVESFTPGDVLYQAVPRFTVTSSHDLLKVPEVFGLQSVTDRGRGHFPGISAEPLAIGQARQDALASFQALGFEAAAVTAFTAVPGGAAPPSSTYRVKVIEVRFDRPFGFLTVHRTSGLILTAGWVAEPEPAGAPAVVEIEEEPVRSPQRGWWRRGS